MLANDVAMNLLFSPCHPLSGFIFVVVHSLCSAKTGVVFDWFFGTCLDVETPLRGAPPGTFLVRSVRLLFFDSHAPDADDEFVPQTPCVPLDMLFPLHSQGTTGKLERAELCIANKQRKVDRAGVLEDQAAVSSFVVALHSTACPPPVSHRESCRQRSSDVGCGTPLLSFFCVFCVFSFFLVCCVVAGKVRHQEKYR